MRRLQSERGAAAVEFALVVPLLLILLLGIVEFGRVFNTQLQLTHAARESVRVMAIQKQPAAARSAGIASVSGLNPALTAGNISVGSCTNTTDVTVTITYSVSLLSGLFADVVPLTGKAVMRCGG